MLKFLMELSSELNTQDLSTLYIKTNIAIIFLYVLIKNFEILLTNLLLSIGVQ